MQSVNLLHLSCIKPVIHNILAQRKEENLQLYMIGNLSWSQMKVHKLCFPAIVVSRNARLVMAHFYFTSYMELTTLPDAFIWEM